MGAPRSGATQRERRRDGRTAPRGTEAGGRGAGPALALPAPGLGRAAAATCRARKPAAHGPERPPRAAPGRLRPTHHAHEARQHLRLRHEAPQVEGAARVGRAVGPALHVAVAVAAEPSRAEPSRGWQRTSRTAPPRSGPGGVAGRRVGAWSLPSGGVANRRDSPQSAPPCLPRWQVAGGRNCLRRQGGAEGRKSSPREVCPAKFTQRGSESPGRETLGDTPHLTQRSGFCRKLSRHPNPTIPEPRLINAQSSPLCSRSKD